MCAVHIGIGHNNYLVITKLTDIKIFMNPCTKGSNHRFNLFIAIDTV